ncbi:HlyD family efflux transporter periplasmic adaptor subunit [Halioxenophilus sp. WMMB6]|uniref:HlyD family efflux transporter periplasmic adaptor subunit n=1 Tax=Halioxenophilus sp. WMMB6 TaxID=3073815 RepID=UPI00295E4C62|nr:HlyD family efflux transporter periplasmic adaptor subunit [Halioxenophilus sp. WMMB6]
MKKPVIALLVGGLVVALSIWLYGHSHGDTGDLTFYGNVDVRQISLAFDGSGRLLTLNVEEGDSVSKGQLLAVLDTRDLALQAQQAEAQIEALRQTLAKLKNGSRPEEIEQARSRLAAAKAEAKRAELELARLKDIDIKSDGRSVSVQELDRALAAKEVAEAQVAELTDGLRLAEQGPRAEDIAVAAAQLQASQAQLALLQYRISLGELSAPADAVVRSRLLEPGDMASPQKPVLALALTQPKWVRIYVHEPDLGHIQPGMAAQLFTDSQPDQAITGQVGYIASVAEFTPKAVQTEKLRTSLVYEVRVVADDANNQLRLGQPVTVVLGNRQ